MAFVILLYSLSTRFLANCGSLGICSVVVAKCEGVCVFLMSHDTVCNFFTLYLPLITITAWLVGTLWPFTFPEKIRDTSEIEAPVIALTLMVDLSSFLILCIDWMSIDETSPKSQTFVLCDDFAPDLVSLLIAKYDFVLRIMNIIGFVAASRAAYMQFIKNETQYYNREQKNE
jgi:hypothetical protein